MGLFPFYIKYFKDKDTEKLIMSSMQFLKKHKRLNKGDKVVVIVGKPFIGNTIETIKTYTV